jgi:hypothetical protein
VEPQPGLGECPFLARRLAESAELRERVRAATERGISLKRFDGWEPATFYHHERGRLVSSTPEVEWDEQEQGWALAYQMYRDSLCRCGGYLPDTTNPRNEGRYRPLLPIQCHHCLALAQSEETYRDEPHPMTLIHQAELRRG